MALITNNISGSSADGWKIGITGSVIFANPGPGSFPSIPGSDSSFFVSGSVGGKGTSGTAIFGGDTVVSGSLTIGTGSITITSNEIRFLGGIAKIYSSSSGLVFEDSSGTKTLSSISTGGGGGGGGDSIFTAASNVAAYTTSSIAIGQAAAANTKGADLFFFVSGSKTSGGRPTSGVASFGGDLSVTGTLYLGDGSVAGIYNRDGGALLYSTSPTSLVLGQDVILNTNVIKANDGNTAITLSSTNVTVAGNITGSNALVNGALTTTGNATIGGNIVADAEEAKSIFVNVGANNVTVGSSNASVVIGNNLLVTGNQISGSAGGNITLQSSGDVEILGDLRVTGNDIKSSTGATSITLAGSSVTVAGNITGSNSLLSGDLAVNGGDITTTASTATLFNSNATTVNIAGAGTSVGIGATSGQTTINNSLTVKGDLYISGTVTTIDSTVTEIQDPVIGLGFSSGSIALAAGDRGFIGGITGAGNNVAFVWSNSNSSFVATRTTSSPTGSVSTAVNITTLQPVRAARFDVGGTSAFVSSSDGTSLLARASGAVTVNSTASKITLNPASNQPIELQIGGVSHAELTGSGGAARFGAVGGKGLILSGSAVDLDSTTGVNFDINGVQAGSITGVPATSLSIFARDGGAGTTARSLIVTGSGVTIGSNVSPTEFAFAGTVRGLASNTNGFTIGSQGGVNLNLSGSNSFLVRHGGTGVEFQQHALPYLTINSSSVTLATNAALITADSGKAMVVGGTSTTIVSGSAVYLNIAKGTAGQGAFFRADSDNVFTIQSGSAGGSLILGSGPTITRADLLNSDVSTVNFAGVATTLSIANTTTSTQTVNLGTASTGSSTYNLGTGATAASTTKTINIGTGGASNSTTNINIGSTTGGGTVTVNENMLPGADVAYDLGSPSFRWRNMYTGDLHLRNDRGDWTIIEEREFLTITNNHSGKRYKFVMEEI